MEMLNIYDLFNDHILFSSLARLCGLIRASENSDTLFKWEQDIFGSIDGEDDGEDENFSERLMPLFISSGVIY